MTTTPINLHTSGNQGWMQWEAEDVDVNYPEATLVSGSSSMIFKIAHWDDITLQFCNHDNTTANTIKVFVSLFDDPGSTDSDFSTDSLWAQAKDDAGYDMSITVAATGTPAANEVFHVADGSRYKWLAIRGSSSPATSNGLQVAVFMTKKIR